jgi:hypothetical protein
MNTTIWATITVPGTHYWPDAHEGREYLAQEHRHLFHVRAEVAVGHDDRDIEFHDLAELLANEARSLAYGSEGGLYSFGSRSCEMLARQLFDWLRDTGGPSLSVVSVEWSEDGEFGAIVRSS